MLAKRRAHIGPNTTLNYRKPLHIVRGEGCHLHDADGVEYLDCVNNVAHVGHCNSKVGFRSGSEHSHCAAQRLQVLCTLFTRAFTVPQLMRHMFTG